MLARRRASCVASPPVPIDDFKNRLTKSARHLRKWAKRSDVHCYRIYDKDLHEYAVAVDLYEDFVHVQEYEAPPKVDAAKAEARLQEVMEAIPATLGVEPSKCFLKVRRRMTEDPQYEKLGDQKQFHEVREGGHRFLVNFTDYLDTGLFLDHRLTRALIEERAAGKDFLNLFAYTGTATVYAAKGGARSTTTVDLSNTYLAWARENLALNGIEESERHQIVRADCTIWVPPGGRRFDFIFLDPPTFSSSKKMQATFDVQRDYVAMLRIVAGWLEKGGALLFSNNFRRFKLHPELLPQLKIEEITARTIPEDFKRNPRIHNAWWITRKADG